MKYYVIEHDFNDKQIKKFDIFEHKSFNDTVNELKEEYLKNNDRDKLIQELDNWCRYYFGSKCEYEIFCCGWFDWKTDKGEEYYPDYCCYFDKDNNDRLVKIDVYYQIKDNLPLIVDGLIREWKN